MIIQPQYNAYLKQTFSDAVPADYPLLAGQSVFIEQDSNGKIVLNDQHCADSCSRCIEIRPVVPRPSRDMPSWQACDLESSQSTYVNGQRLQGCQTLQVGDRISFGQQDGQFTFECQIISPAIPGGTLNIQPGNTLRLSQVLPFISTKQDLFRKAHLIPGILTVLLVVGLFASIDHPLTFNALLAIYLVGASYYFIYQMCGKSKPLWLLLGSAITTYLLLRSLILPLFFFVFYTILPGGTSEGTDTGFPALFIHSFFGAGMMEELIKALPVFAALAIGRRLKSPRRERVGIWEPLDGILLATASAAGFILFETMEQYVPYNIEQVTGQLGAGAGELYGIQLLIPRLVSSVAGHMAYSGYFGYFIGLSALKPSRRWSILTIGYFTAAALHALWNTSAINGFATASVGVLAYAFLMAAILKARQLSPVRSQNWATQHFNPVLTAQAAFFLQIQHRVIPLTIGTQLRLQEITGLGTHGADKIVAEVNTNPTDPTILGLQNCSSQVWTATLATGPQKSVDPNRSIRLIAGTKIDFGLVQGEVRSQSGDQG